MRLIKQKLLVPTCHAWWCIWKRCRALKMTEKSMRKTNHLKSEKVERDSEPTHHSNDLGLLSA